VKTENSLKTALEKLGRLDDVRNDLKADNLHELMRVHEAMNIQQVAKITATAARARKETRFPPYHYRADYLETDDENFCGLIVVKKGENDEITTRFEPLFYDV
jgi:adenylylsulfate reductase subunit A